MTIAGIKNQNEAYQSIDTDNNRDTQMFSTFLARMACSKPLSLELEA